MPISRSLLRRSSPPVGMNRATGYQYFTSIGKEAAQEQRPLPVELFDGAEQAAGDKLGLKSEFGVDSAREAEVLRNDSTFPSPTGASHALRILVVDDNRDSAISLSILLSLTGHETTTAFDGEEALTASSLFAPSVILLDIGMPKLNGYEVCRELWKVPRERPLVIIALTGWGQEEDRRKSLEAGFDAHLVKPVDPDALQRTLRELIRRKDEISLHAGKACSLTTLRVRNSDSSKLNSA